MWSYLSAAFWARPEIPGLGRVPVNAILLGGLALLGFGHQGFWLAGIAAETLYLFLLTTNGRFQNLVDAENSRAEGLTAEAQRQNLLNALTPPRREIHDRLEQKCERILRLHREGEPDALMAEDNREALQKLLWIALKLLLAQQNISSLQSATGPRELYRQIAEIHDDLRQEKLSPSLRESKEATLRILEQRLANLDRREQSLEEIESDLTRVEAQVDLALENAGMRGKCETISANIDLVSHLLDDSVYGDSGASIAAIEQSYGQRA